MIGSRAAHALVNIADGVADNFKVSKSVVVGSVVSTDPAHFVLKVKTDETLSGEKGLDEFTLQIPTPPELSQHAKAGDPVVLFVGKSNRSSVHVGDAWLSATLKPGTSVYLANGLLPAMNHSFPGRTAALVRLVHEIKDKKPTLLNKIDNHLFPEPPRSLGKLPATSPTRMLPVPLAANGPADLLIKNAEGFRLLHAGAGNVYSDATESSGLGKPKAGEMAAVAKDGAGKTLLLVGDTLFTEANMTFTPAAPALTLPAGAKIAACALVSLHPNGAPDALVLLNDGQLLRFENPKTTGQPWKALPARTLWKDTPGDVLAAAIGDFSDDAKPYVMVVRSGDAATAIMRYPIDPDDGPPADFQRLTGQKLADEQRAWAGGIKEARAITIDVNGDKRPDFLILADGAGLLLVNRGFGAFIPSADPGPFVHEALPPGALIAAADMKGAGQQSVLILDPQGNLKAVDPAPSK